MIENKCLCGSELEYEKCCALYIEKGEAVPDATAMVRSRFVAFCLQKYDYLVESTHPDFRNDLNAEGIKKSSENIQWLKLELGEEKEYIDPKGGCFKQISFVAYFEENKKPRQFAETSFFQEKDERLYYVHSVENKPPSFKRVGPKTGRNEVCPCGSNKKYKKCCGKQV